MLLIPSLAFRDPSRLGDLLTAVRMYEHKGATWLYLLDEDGEDANAPQNVEAVHQVIGATEMRVLFEGGVRLMHTARMMLGLGAERVVINPKRAHTEAAVASMFARLGDAAVARVESVVEAQRLIALGARRVIYTVQELAQPRLVLEEVRGFSEVEVPAVVVLGVWMLEDECNARLVASVGIEAAVLRGEPGAIARALSKVDGNGR